MELYVTKVCSFASAVVIPAVYLLQIEEVATFQCSIVLHIGDNEMQTVRAARKKSHNTKG